MIVSWLRRTAVLAVACASAALIAGCGSGTVDSAISPSRFVVFGDGLSDLGQNGYRYTVNDGSVNIWTQQLASNYGVGVSPVSLGGSSYAVGNARVTLHPDAAGVAATPTITEQITTFLAAGAPKSSDLIVIEGGLSDIISGLADYRVGTTTSAQYIAASTQAGTELGAQVRRMVSAGAKYVMVTGTYDVGRSPFGTATGLSSVLTSASTAFNTALELAIADLGSNVLYVDSQYYYNLQIGVPSSYSFNDAVTVVCTSVDPGNGTGVGTGQISSALCNTGTIQSGLNYTLYEFADNVYFTPQAQRLFGNYAYDRLRLRF